MSRESTGPKVSSLAPGLYLVATPIGNLEDITLRALRVLKEADLIACEDTRHTLKLLNHYAIETATISYHQHNEASRAAELIEKLRQKGCIALVSDAGMPAISDPGFRLVDLAITHNVQVIPVPGASAFVAAFAAAGLPDTSFCFNGFLPPRRAPRREALARMTSSPQPQAFYEAPHRLAECLLDIEEVLGPDRQVVVARELTKVHEEFLRGSVREVSGKLKTRGEIRGEITVIIGKAQAVTSQTPVGVDLRGRFDQIMKDERVDEKSALKKLAKEIGASKSEVYRRLQRSRSS